MRWQTGIAALLLLGLAMVSAHYAAPWQPRIERLVAFATDGQVQVTGLGGSLAGEVVARRVELRDADGVWLTIDDFSSEVTPKLLLAGELHIDRLRAGHVTVARAPVSGGGQASLPIRIVLDQAHVDRLDVAGVSLGVDGSGQLTAIDAGDADLVVRPVAEPGEYRVTARVDAATLHVRAQADEPAGGLLARFSQLPGLGALSIGVSADGPWAGAETRLDVKAGELRLAAAGHVDLPGRASDLEVTASAPAMTPRSDLSWQAVTLQAQVTGAWDRPHASGTLAVDDLVAGGASVHRLEAELTGDLGHVGVRATLEGLLLPGPIEKRFAAAPVSVNADVDLTAPDRPVRVELSHPLLDASGTIRTGGEIGAELTLHAPDLAGMAPDLRGALTAELHVLGPLDDPSVQAAITGEVAAAGLPCAALTAGGGAPGRAPSGTGELTAAAGGSRVRVTAELDEQARVVAHLEGRGIGPAETLRLDAEGTQDALTLRAAADGAGVQATAAATLDAVARRLTVTALQATWQNERLALQAPARVSLADGVALDRATFGLRQATLGVSGRAAPTLDLKATLRGLPASLADAFVPGLGADGTVDGEARLTGTTGTLRLTGSGLRLRNGVAAAFPAASASATATLAGPMLRIDAHAAMESARLNVVGTVPLSASGALGLHATGTLDLALFDRVLAAAGQRARGKATLDATIGGSMAAPRFGGTLALAGGEVQDAVHGIRIHAIEVRLRANGDNLRIERLAGAAGAGTISARGSVGLTPPLPVSIDITASNATPIASDALTATLDGSIALRGSLADGVTTKGAITVRQADIRVPERQPASIAVLNISGANQPPPPPPGPDIGLDVTVNAPGRVFVRGHGLDAELAGTIHVRGTAAEPRADGKFTLSRGTFNLAGQTLTFASGTIGLEGGGTDPTLDLTANSSNAGITATLEVTGTASAPKFTLSSAPPLPQDEILARLLFGTSASSLSALQLAQIAAGLAELSGVSSGLNPLERLRSGLGLDRLSVGSGSGSGTAVEAGRNIAPGVYLGARQSTSGNGTTGTLQIDLGHGLKLQTDIGTASAATPGANATGGGTTDSGGTGVGIVWQFEY